MNEVESTGYMNVLTEVSKLLNELAEAKKEIKRLTESLIYYVKESYKGEEVA